MARDQASKGRLCQEKEGAIGEAVVAVLANTTMQEGSKQFSKDDITAAPVYTVAQATADPHPWERPVMVEVPAPIAGKIPVSGGYWHFGRSEVVVGSTPAVGQHTDELLGDLLHYTLEQLSELREARVMA
jgi:formyl-CoA transferase